jgi:very-short-patch-repair endonuclease
MGAFSSLPDSSGARRAQRDALKARDAAVAALAAEQEGVIARAQLLDLGVTESQIKERTDRTLWPVGPAVFALGHPGIKRRGLGKAVLLQAGDQAGLSHLSAGRLWEMVPAGQKGPVHVSLLHRRKIIPPPGVVIHRPPTLTAEDLVEHNGLRVVTPERTAIDLLPTSTVAEITRMLEQMVTHLGRSPDALHDWGQALKHVRGKPKLTRALDNVAGPAVIRSEFEALFRAVCLEGGLPIAETNQRIGRWEVDALYRELGVAIELDSYRWHGGRWQFHRDRRKGLAISSAGYELIRISWPQLKHERHEVIEAIRYALARGAARRA